MPKKKIKICLFGDGNVGKTTLVNRFLTGMFETDYKITIGVELYIINLDIEGINVTLQIWDFAGEKEYRYLFPSYVNGAEGGIFMFDITQKETLTNLYEWLLIFKESSIDYENDIPLIMVGGKLDLQEKRAVQADHIEKVAEKFKFKSYLECSSKTGENVEECFEEIAKIIMKKEGLI